LPNCKLDLFYYIFQASNDKKSQREISDIAGVAEVTIKQSYRLMRDRAAELFPENFEFTTTVEQLPAS
jgi:transcription initiation factor TFIIB